MKKVFLSLFFIWVFANAYAQLGNYYLANAIPDSLAKNADVVKRYEQVQFEVKDIDKAIYNIHTIKTVLNKDGASALSLRVFANKLRSLGDVEVNVYDANGMLIRKYKKKDLTKQAAMSEFVEDGTYYYLSVPAIRYPVTVEYIYQLTYTGTLTYPWYYIAFPSEAVEYSSFTAKIPAGLGGLRFKAQNTGIKPEMSTVGNSQLYQWKIENLAAQAYEPGSVNTYYVMPAILLAPNKFKHFNSYGDLSSWKGFGEWGYNLLNGLDDLPEWRKEFLRALTEKASSDREKVAILYDYLQQNFRYVSIQVGIGGVKPFSAKFTDEKKYGDCKGLSFYMYSALKAVGIKSHVAFINSKYNDGSADPEFPIDIFNHVILCVPQTKDSIWLECTSKTSEFGELGTFTENRKALLLTENGGVLVSTPRSRSSANVIRIKNEVSLFEDGSGILQSSIESRGKYKELIGMLNESKRDDQKILIVNHLGFKQPDDFVIKNNKANQSVYLEMAIENVPQFKAGSKMFLSPRLHSLIEVKLPKTDNRKNDFYFECPYEIYDTTVYKLPDGYVVDVLPETQQIDNTNGDYQVKYWFDETANAIYASLIFKLDYHIIPAAEYQSVKEFFDKVGSTETKKIVIKKG